MSRFTIIRQMCERLSVKSLLDIGCSDGALSHIVAEANGVEADGIEIEPRCVKFANKYAQDNKLPCRFFETTFEEFQADKKYDAVVACEVIEHVMNPTEFIEKMNSLGKYIFITTPNKQKRKNDYDQN